MSSMCCLNLHTFGLLLLIVCTIHQIRGACDFNNYLDYINTWNNRYYTEAHKLYPFGDTYCDQNVTSYSGQQTGFNPQITHPIYFYGVKYISMWVSPHGMVSLNETMNPPGVGYHFERSWPNENYPNQYDPPFMAPFYSEADFRPFESGPAAFSWRILDPTDQSKPSNEQQITVGMLEALQREIRLGVVGEDNFMADYGIIITWYKVTFYASSCTSENCVRNTYQMAVVVGGTKTFVIYNYFDINWVGGAGYQQCDPSTGIRTSSYQNCHAAHIGFNAGYGRVFNALPYSNDVDLTKEIDKKSGSNVVGRFIYSVAGDKVVRGGCTNDTSLDNIAWPLEATPMYTDMVGGTSVEVSGPCFHQNMIERVKCSFGDVQTDPIMRSDTTMKAVCVPPPLDFIGATKLGFSDNGGISFKYEKQIIINLLGRNPPKAQVTVTGGDWLNPYEISVTWNPNDLQNSNIVDIMLIGYKEDSLPGEIEVETWEHLETIAETYANSGTFAFNPNSVQCGSGQADRVKCFQYHVGAIQIAEHREDPSTPRGVWTEIIPFGWYIKTEMQTEHGNEWPAYICQEWAYLDDRNGGWSDRSKLLPCPCTLQQATADYGRYQTDPGCYQGGSRSNNCHLNIGAIHCVVSIYSTKTEGSGNRCCYNNDHNLMYAGDNLYGSRPDRAHEWGQSPYGWPPRIPTMSHWLQDIAPWYYCCQWQENKDQCFNLYLDHRQTVDCYQYQPPGHASSYGDPHFSTFDGTLFTFNGHGEFWFLKVSDVILHGETIDFQIQMRMEQPPINVWGDVLATFTTAIAVKLVHKESTGNDQTLTFLVDEFYVNSDNKLLIYVNEQLLSFSDSEAYAQQFNDFIIINNDPEGQKLSTNFTVSFYMGIGLQVSFHNGLIHCIIAAPPEFKGKTSGVIGLWNDNPDDDLMPQGSTTPVSPDDPEMVHYDFGLTWMIDGSDSLFEYIYRASLDYNYYKDETFVPEFNPGGPEPNNSRNYMALSPEYRDICDNNAACQYDYMVTSSENVALETKSAEESLTTMRLMATKVSTCGWLSVPNSIKQEPYDYFVGSTVIISGCMHSYRLEGPTSFTCVVSGDQPMWNPAPTSTRCIGPDEKMSPAIIAAIAVPLALILFLLLFGIVVCIIWVHKKRIEGKPTRKAEQDKNYIDDSFSQAMPPISLKTSGKPRPAVTPNRSYEVTDTDTSIEKIGVNTKHSYNDNPYSDLEDVKQNNGKKEKSKRRKSANLDDSISIESEKDKIIVNVAPTISSQNTGQSVSVSYKPDPIKNKKDKNKQKYPPNKNDSPKSEIQTMPSDRQRKPPYKYPIANTDVLASYGYPKRNPYYNPYNKASSSQRKYPPYVYPVNTWSNQSSNSNDSRSDGS